MGESWRVRRAALCCQAYDLTQRPLLTLLASFCSWLWWWAAPVASSRRLARVLADPPARLPRVPGRIVCALWPEEPGWSASHVLRRASDPAAALRVYLSLPGVGEPELLGATRWLNGAVLAEPLTLRLLLTHPGCSDRLAAHLVSEAWFLGFGRVRELHEDFTPSLSASRLIASIELREREEDRLAAERDLLPLLTPFPAASLLLSLVRAFPATTPRNLMQGFESASALTPAAREVFYVLLADHLAALGAYAHRSLELAEILELIELARHCLI